MFEVKLLVTAPGLETAINNLAVAIATGAAPMMTAHGGLLSQGEALVMGEVPQQTVTYVAPVTLAPTAVVSTDDDSDGETSTEEFDKWGLRHDSRIHTDSKSLNKGDGLWRQKKKLDDAFVDGVKRELITEAVAAGRYAGPAEMNPGYQPPVVDTVVVPAAPVTQTVVVPVAPVNTPVAPANTPVAPANTPVDPAKVYNAQVLQSAVMQMFQTVPNTEPALIAPRLLALYETDNIMTITDETKLKSIITLVESIIAAPANSAAILSGAESMKAVGAPF